MQVLMNIRIKRCQQMEKLDVHHYGLYNGFRLIDYRIARTAGMKNQFIIVKISKGFLKKSREKWIFL